MARSQAERDATAAIEAAILQYRDAYKAANPEAQMGVVMEWIIVAAEMVGTDDDGDNETAYALMMSDGSIPWHRAYGLLHYGLKNLEGIHGD